MDLALRHACHTDSPWDEWIAANLSLANDG